MKGCAGNKYNCGINDFFDLYGDFLEAVVHCKNIINQLHLL